MEKKRFLRTSEKSENQKAMKNKISCQKKVLDNYTFGRKTKNSYGNHTVGGESKDRI